MGYYLKAPMPEAQVAKMQNLAQTLREDPVKGKHTDEMLQVSSGTIGIILEHLFIEPLNRVNAGAVSRKAAAMGIKTGLSMFTKIARKSFAGFSSDQLLGFADWLEDGIGTD
ncbi:hypothetical protein SAMN02745216_02735 [Desulfatibacillum alkenivorans DSM 16219]|jgi:hypothetical protein|uniref:Uncharacterized protein n=1 Tax=Desulfatibacillum alkenivorans DSM 16219 TaxID=1121393 RepID=A0A1M6P1V6_9BACT|nr:hypothetical protein [Desulfatibacillum alkenivorans]SHK01955.1 hypothetical protein SAMN02745216_02735 [Desulfatibacillum alkenivorans DSM 16219]